MTAHVPRLPFALDPLMAEAKKRARQRRTRIVLAVLLLAGVGGGVAFALGSPGGGSRSGGGPTGASQHATAAQQEAIAQARTQIGYLRAFPALPGTAPCIVHPGGLQKPGTVFHGLCTTQVTGGRAGEGTTRITFTERFRVAGLAHHPGSFIVTVSRPDQVVYVRATGQTPQTWR
jgi:hypothetical protein